MSVSPFPLKPKPFQIQTQCPFESFFNPEALYGVSVLSNGSHTCQIYAFGFNGDFDGAIELDSLNSSFSVEGIPHESYGSLTLYKGKIYLGFCLDILENHVTTLLYKKEHPPLIIYKVVDEHCVDKLIIDSKEMLIDFLEYQLSLNMETQLVTDLLNLLKK